MSNNTISIIGHVGQKPTVKTFGDTNNKLVKFSVAVKEYSPNRDEPRTIWFDVDAWNGAGERVLKTVTKGREIKIDGRLSLNSYTQEKDGVALLITKPVIKLTSFHLCGKRPESPEAEAAPQE